MAGISNLITLAGFLENLVENKEQNDLEEDISYAVIAKNIEEDIKNRNLFNAEFAMTKMYLKETRENEINNKAYDVFRKLIDTLSKTAEIKKLNTPDGDISYDAVKKHFEKNIKERKEFNSILQEGLVYLKELKVDNDHHNELDDIVKDEQLEESRRELQKNLLEKINNISQTFDHFSKMYQDDPDSFTPDIKEELCRVADKAEGFRNALAYPVPPLPEIDRNYEKYKSRTDAYAHLGKWWGTWLTHFNKGLSRDYFSQDLLGKYDPKLMDALRNQKARICHETECKKISEIIPPKTKRLDADYKQMSEEELKEITRIASSISAHRPKNP